MQQVTASVNSGTSGIQRYVAGEHMDTDDARLRRWGTVGDGYLGPAFHRHFTPGQILYGSRRTYLRKVAVADFEGICANTTFVCEPKTTRLVPGFLLHVMRSERFHAHSIAQSKGSVNPYVNWKDIARFEFRLPDSDAQRRVAELLSYALASVDRKRAVLRAAETVARACRHRAFAPVQPRVALGELVEMQLGKMLSQKARSGANQRRYLANINVRWGEFDLSELKTMSFDQRELEKFRLAPGDVLVCEGRGVGRSAVWRAEIDDCYYQKALHRLRLRDGRVTPQYLVEYFRWCSDAGRFAALVGDSLIPHLTEVKFRDLQVAVPDRDSLQRFLASAASIHELVVSTQDNINTLVAVERELSDRLVGT